MAARLTTKEFIARAIAVHGELYDYSLVVYLGCEVPVKIICRVHGVFEQKPDVHVMSNGKKHGCKKCSGYMVNNLIEFIAAAIAIHGSKYDYSLAVYVNAHTKLCIVCPTHGEFWQLPLDHLKNRSGCSKCAGKMAIDTPSFIAQAIFIHGEEFDYSEVEWIRSNRKVHIICSKHGVFEQTPNQHLRGHKCPTCFLRFASREEFIEHATALHKGVYDYSLVVFIDCMTKVKIICRDHGVFEQTPSNHLQPNGCPKCSGRVSFQEERWLDDLGIAQEHRQYKIGTGRKHLSVDAYDPATNTVYEFYGDYWHGNPRIYDPEKINIAAHKSFGTLYQKTLAREERIKALGYKLITIWESDFINQSKTRT